MRRLWHDERGQGMVEYALLAALISVALIAVIVTLRADIAAVFASISDSLNPAE